MNKMYQKIAQKPALVMLVIIGLTSLFIYGIGQNARIETDLDEYMPSDHPAFVFSDKAEEQFGIKDNVLLAIEHPESIFNPGTLEKIKSISEELPEQFDDIDEDDITSLYTAENITADEWSLIVESFYEEVPQSNAQIKKLQSAVEGNDMIHGRIVSTDGSATLIIAEIGEETFTDRFYADLQDFAASWEGPETVHIAGRPVVEGELTKLGPQDMARMAPLVLLVMTLLLLILLRSVRNTIINLLIVLFGTLTAFGLMTLLNIPIYTLSTMIPVMLTAIGVADGIHMHNSIVHIVHRKPDISRENLVEKTMEAMVRPVTMTSITTAVGFLALLTSDVLPVRYFGLFTALGIMMEMLMALILFPASIYFFGPPKQALKSKQAIQSKVTAAHKPSTISGRFGEKLLAHPKLVVTIAILAVALALLGTTRVWIDTSFLANFEDDSQVVKTDKFVNEHFGGTSSLNVILSSDEEDTFKQPEVLETMNELQMKIEKNNPLVGDSFALTDYMRRMHQVMHEDNPEYDKIPDSQELIAQYLLLYEMSGDPDNLNQVVDYDYMNANLTFQLKSDSSAVMEEVIAEIEPYIPQLAEYGVEVDYAGSGYKSLVFANLLMEGQIISLLLSFGIVALLLSLMFGSLWIGLAGTIPIAVTATVNFGTMGLLGIPLSSSTAIISAIAIGIGVDYAIHLIERYRFNRIRGVPTIQAAYETLEHTGRAIIYNAAAVMGGFAVLLVSVFPPNRQVGGLVALNMATSAIGTLTILLVVLVFIDRHSKIYSNKISTEEE
ncbi:MAG: MMPL family transporter [Spirochaetaceae bacterium]|nr:MMPL family transporter [Spirochaetaceae bacterium]MCF7947779.1 MMPL family transporter [Spirochaetia bacterium]MCF7952394.1 MMPL family transporter [Spirochaetaceae bacterium]